MINFSKENIKKLIIPGAIMIAVIVIGSSLMIFLRPQNIPYRFTAVKRGNINQEVNATGRTKSADDIDLAFERPGRIIGIYAKVGDKVFLGQKIAVLDNSDLIAQLAGADAGVEAQQARLDELKRGARPEELEIKENELKRSEQDLSNLYGNTINMLNDVYIKADDAVRKQLDDLFVDDEINPKLSFVTTDGQAEIDVESERSWVSTSLNTWRSELGKIDDATPVDILEQEIENSKSYLAIIRQFLNRLTDAVSGVPVPGATVNIYKADVDSVRAIINSAVTNVTTLEQSIASQRLVLQRVREELNLEQAGASAEQIAAQNAQVAAAEAIADGVRAQVEKTILRSPIAGIVTKANMTIGELIASNQPAASVISGSGFEIETNISEADISEIKIGSPAKVTLDAYGESVVFDAKVTAIDLASTIIDGSPAYKVTLQFKENDDRIKSGLTANISIYGEKRENALMVPESAIITRSNEKFVLVMAGKTPEQKKVLVGIYDSNGNTEIISGLSEGESVAVF